MAAQAQAQAIGGDDDDEAERREEEMEKALQDLEDIYDEYHLVDEMASMTVLEKELERCKAEAKKAGLSNKPLLKFFLDRCDFIKI